MTKNKEFEWLKKQGITIKSIKEMENLDRLDLSYKKITDFPKFEHLQNLKSLYLHRNQLAKFSGKFPRLEFLYLDDNQLTKFSGDFPNLEVLDLSGNQLTDFQGNHPNLKFLGLSDNKLTNFSGNYPDLEWLDLDHNQLIDFSGNYLKLKKLNLNKNQLTNFSGYFLKLEYFCLENNELTQFSGNYPNLIELNLYNNQLTEFSGNFPKIRCLNLENNELTQFSGDYPDLNRLRIYNNPIKELPMWLSNVESVIPFPFIYYNNIELVNKILQDKLTAREVLGIEDIELRRVAYERMDKSKMSELKKYSVLDEGKDDKGNTHRIVSFEVEGYEEPFKYYHCKCTSTNREYFVGTDKDKVWAAKAHSFGINNNVKWVNEW